MTATSPTTDPAIAPDRGPDHSGGLGALRTDRGNLPLDRLHVRADITGLVSRVELTQDFVNVHDAALEATYVFPLPDRAAVTGMRMVAADRVVEAKLAERGAAREEYDRAIAAGRRASIAEQERPDVFTMRVGNIVAGERVSVTLTLAGPLPQEDGAATFRFPLVVAPRYVPGAPLPGPAVGDGHAPDTDAVPDASRISPPVLLAGFPNPLRLSIDVGIDPAGLPLAAVRSSLHTVVEEDGRLRVRPGERADRDFVLRLAYGDPDGAPAASLVTVPDAEGDEGTFQLTVLPPAVTDRPRPRDVVLLLDRSGSMQGWKMVAARRAAARIVDTLGAADRFAVLAFDHVVEGVDTLPAGLVAATDRHRFRAVEHLAGVRARGGTELLEPLQRGLGLLAADEPGRDRVLVLVTDGQVGNEDQILREAAAGLTDVRVHTVGVDRAVNAGFLGRLAAAGAGRCELVESEDRLDEAMATIHRRIGAPLVTGLAAAAEGLDVVAGSLVPGRLPDLFPGVPYVVAGRYRGTPTGGITLSGTTRDDRAWSAAARARPGGTAALTAIWARARLRDLEDRYASSTTDDPATLERTIVETSLRFGVLCRFTAHLAVDSRVVAEGGPDHRIVQPVEPVSGWEPPAGPLAVGRLTPLSPAAGAPAFVRQSASEGSVRAARGATPLAAPSPVPPAPPAAGPAAAGAVDGPAALAAREARRLRDLAGRPAHERREALDDLGSRLAALADDGPLRDLAEALRPEAVRGRPLDELLADVLRVLDAVAAGSAAGSAPRRDRRRSFWRRT
ncbi:VIT domain-containing protein [Pseudonocardia humida]|uniref:VWA domain-containing protein n=1 Tax=Pseudonocardia humida TaxID=2800819 RepID=A0ABT0ZYA3_9PSEU|nr:VIT domain-containing protein [Pseudonocardia humida]MCO1655634.1 VWA domain-containing protein [Pseudonocardia humida]